MPLLVAWLLIDRDPKTPKSPGARYRWLTPAVVCVILGVTAIADASVLLTGIIPLVLVCLVRACPGVMRGKRTEPKGGISCPWPGPGGRRARLLRAARHHGPRRIPRVARPERHGAHQPLGARSEVDVPGVLELFGADFYQARPGIEVAFAVVHLVGAILVVGALLLALARFFRFTDLLIPVFAVGIVLNLGAYLTSTRSHGILSTREIAGVLRWARCWPGGCSVSACSPR